MASSPIADVGIFDDFADAKKMSSTVCQQVSLEEYEEHISSETDKALGDLCLYLDQHPEVYAQILRKRKQEDLENSGIVSFMKSKMMKLVHGEDYPECLVSLSDCMQQTNALKAGLCKTFQYSQEVKGTPNRYSKRLAAKRNALENTQSPLSDSWVDISLDSLTKTLASKGTTMTALKENDPETASNKSVKLNSSPPSCLSSSGEVTASDAHAQRETGCSPHGQIDPEGKIIHLKAEPISPERCRKDKSKACPSPPTPPPLPPFLTVTAQSPWTAPRKTLSSLALNVGSRNSLSRRRSPRVGKGAEVGQIAPSGVEATGDGLNLGSKKESPFLTPMVSRKKTHKRSLSNSSVGSGNSVGSVGSVNKSIQSEILSSNPIQRLKVTQIARSPGGTPLRPELNGRLSSEPLHKALVTAMKTKFKNVNTPSPRSGNVSLNGSTASDTYAV